MSACERVSTGSRKMGPTRLTVAGDATDRSSTSKIMRIQAVMVMISPDTRQSFLFSSSTVFMLSIHSASTGPSKTTHFWRALVS